MKKVRYFIKLSYLGKNFHGWQIQPNAPSVQAELNNALSIILKEDIATIGCGRTDTGVHAQNFVAHFDSINTALHSDENICYKLNGILSKDIQIHKIINVPDECHARFDASSRTYKYFISRTKDPFTQETCHFIYGTMDIPQMNAAAKALFDYIDFTSFSKLHTDVKTNNCKILHAQWEEVDNRLIFTISADRFLRNMVRSIVGTMIDIGFHKISMEEFKTIIEKKDRCLAGASAPAKGLFLWDIIYPYDI